MVYQQVIEMLYKIKGIVLIGLLFGLTACPSNKDTPNPEVDFDEAALLTKVADDVIIVNLTKLEEDLASVETALKSFELDESIPNKESLQNSLVELTATWNTVAAFQFGPANAVVLSSLFNTYPVDIDEVEANISSKSYNLEVSSSLDATGLNALDYLFFGDSSLTTDRIEYSKAILNQLQTSASFVSGKWNSEYRSLFISNVGTENGSSISTLLNAVIQHFETRIRNGKLRNPSGLFLGNVIDTTLVEARFSRVNSLNYFNAAMEGVNSALFGANSIHEYVKAYNVTVLGGDVLLADQLTKEYNDIITLSESLNNDDELIDLLQTDRASVVALHDEVQDLIALLKVDVTNTLKVAITYLDTDGD